MGTVCKLSVFVFVALVAYFARNAFERPPLPNIPDTLWKKDDNPNDDKIYSFSIDVPQQRLNQLKDRLRNTTFHSPLEGVNFEYGFNTDHLKTIINFWINHYKWEERKKLLNAVPHFRTKISGLNIHFIHVKPTAEVGKTKKVFPLLMLHGWPGSVKEFYGVFSLLTQPRSEYDFVFEVIVPSLPGYGFSDAATIPGLNTAQVGLIMKKLMNRLGFTKFYVQGGDWGAVIGSQMSTLYPDSLLGFHSNMCGGPMTMWTSVKLLLGSIYPSLFVDTSKFRHLYPLKDFFRYFLQETGYLHIQATKPDTIGVALNDSPAGLAAYILEKFSTWENDHWRQRPDGGLNLNLAEQKNYSFEDLLDNIMIYWMTNSITSSLRLYSETLNVKTFSLELDKIPSIVPTACANYPHDIMYTPENILRDKFLNLVHNSHMPRGGHFAAFEQPELFSADLWTGICKIENFVHNLKRQCDFNNVTFA